MRSTDRPASLGRRIWPAVALAGASGILLKAIDSPASGVGTLRVAGRTATTPSTAPTTVPSNGGGGNTPTSTVPAAPGTCSGTKHTGQSVDTRWGPVQVEAVVSANGTICSAHAIVTPSDHDRSIFINQQAVPLIDQEIPTQGINFLSVIGATVTSDGYRSSLQSVLDALPK